MPVTLIRRATVQDVDNATFQNPPPLQEKKVIAAATPATPTSQLPARFLDFVQGDKPDPKLKARWDGDTTGLEDTSRSGVDMSLTALLTVLNFSDEDIFSVLIHFPHGEAKERYEHGNSIDTIVMIQKVRRSHDTHVGTGEALLALSSDGRISRKKRLEIAWSIQRHLQAQGTFYVVSSPDDGSEDACYLDSEEHQLYHLGTRAFRALCNERFGLNPAESIARFVEQHLVTHCLRHGLQTETYRLARYQDGTLYVDAGGHKVFKLDGQSIATINNGDDGILFEHPSTQVPIDPEYQYTGSPVRQHLVNIANPVAPDQLNLYEPYIYSLFFESILPTKPILAWFGPKGSAKTSVCRALKCALLGSNANVDTGLTDKLDAFWAAVCHTPFVCIDNVDTQVRWLPDALATLSTGVKFNRRRLYKTNALVDYTPRCFPILTSRNPQCFTRDDVADRLLIIEVERRKDFTEEAALMSQLTAMRGQIWGELLINLNKIVAELKKPAPSDPLPHRMADWARLAVRIAPILGIENIQKQLEAMARSKIDFVLCNDPVAQAVAEWIDAHPGHQPISTGALYKALCERHQAKGRKFPISSPQAFGVKLSHLESELQQRYQMESTKGPDNTKLIRFTTRNTGTL